MFRLIKLAFYGILGYILYELFLGITQGAEQQQRQGGQGQGGGRSRGGGSPEFQRAANEDPGRMRMSGQGRGQDVETQDATGASSHHRVGRGVVQQ